METADPVVMSRVIANSVLADMRASNGQHVEALSVVNLLRLLEMYEAGTFYARQPLGVLEQDNFSDLNGMGSGANFERLKTALKRTHESLSPQLSPKEFVDGVRTLLAPLTANATSTANETTDGTEIERFLSALTKSLSNV